MNRCPGCGYIVPGGWAECRRCGAAIAVTTPAPAPAISVGAGPVLAPPPNPPPPPFPQPEFDAYVEPVVIRAAPRPQTRFDGRTIAIAVLAVAVTAAGIYSAIPHGGHNRAAPPTILAPETPAAGIPTSLSAVVRIAAESSRHTALSTVMATAGDTGATVTVTQLAAAQPNYQWVPGDQPSTTNTIISVTSAPAGDVIAVSGTSRDVCAFGRWSPATGAGYMTMAHVATCSASAAPATGWTAQAGGSAQDLPGVGGG